MNEPVATVNIIPGPGRHLPDANPESRTVTTGCRVRARFALTPWNDAQVSHAFAHR